MPLKEVLKIACADGQQLPYLGCIEAKIIIITRLERATPQQCNIFSSSIC